MATPWVVLAAAFLCVSLASGQISAPCDPVPPPCDQEPVTPSPPLGPCLSQNIEKITGTPVPYVLEAAEEVFVPFVQYAPCGQFNTYTPVEQPSQKPPALPAPLPFSLPTPPPQGPVYSFLSQAANSDPAAALNAISKVLAAALPPQLQAAASVSASPPPSAPCNPHPSPYNPPPAPYNPPPAPCNSPPAPILQHSFTLLPQTITSAPAPTTLDLQTLLKLGLLQPLSGSPALQPNPAAPLDANTIINLGALQPSNTLPPEFSSVLSLGTVPQTYLPLSGLSPEVLAQLTVSGTPPAAPSVTIPTAIPTTMEITPDESSKLGLIKNAWSKLYDPLRRLRTHTHL